MFRLFRNILIMSSIISLEYTKEGLAHLEPTPIYIVETIPQSLRASSLYTRKPVNNTTFYLKTVVFNTSYRLPY